MMRDDAFQAVSRETADRVLEMRRTFDRSFAARRAERESDVENIVILEIGSLQVACRVEQITRFEIDRKVVPLSGGAPGLIGLAGIRGKLVPVFGLAVLLGVGASRATRWLAFCGGSEPIALTFDRLDRFVQARRADICALEEGGGGTGHVKEVLRLGSESHHVLDIASVLARVQAPDTNMARTAPKE